MPLDEGWASAFGMNLGRNLGLALCTALLAASCSDAATATVGFAAGSTAEPAASHTEQRGRMFDRTELRPYPIRVRGKYYVRMGAFDDRDAARDLAFELRRVTTEPVEAAEYLSLIHI